MVVAALLPKRHFIFRSKPVTLGCQGRSKRRFAAACDSLSPLIAAWASQVAGQPFFGLSRFLGEMLTNVEQKKIEANETLL